MKEIIIEEKMLGGVYAQEVRGELVRCKDCKYWQDNNDGYPHPDCRWGNYETPDPDDYCSGAEPK